jgi:hypothetical protein
MDSLRKKKIFSIFNVKNVHFILLFFLKRRTIENSLRDAVHRFYQGVFYLRNVLRFCGTSVNVISPLPSSRFPKRVPYRKRCPSPESLLHILQGPQQGALPPGSLHRAPTERERERERERDSTSRAPFNHISKFPVDEPIPGCPTELP